MLWNRPGSTTPRTTSSRGLSGLVIVLAGVRSFTSLVDLGGVLLAWERPPVR